MALHLSEPPQYTGRGRIIIICGPPTNFPTLLHWVDWVRQAGVAILSFYMDKGVPVLSLVSAVNGQTFIHERCFIWAGNAQSAIQIVPDGFKYGAFVVDPEKGLKHLKRAPFSRAAKGIPGVREAVSRLERLWSEHMEANPDVSLPTYLKKKAA